ncbi:MAG: FKBP-type peptidyl-prolyl cis-trans isomerase [Bacteroidaceae bacterium]|nr:FKBP-type peptidyl-prolyl cis-trans isomerase [Bacteroidaceae bacterium]
MKGNFVLLIGLVCLASLVSCSEQSNEWNPYYSWESRNSLWFAMVADSARTAIAEAKAQYGDEWEENCQWRMFKSLQRSADFQGPLTDSIVCKINKKGSGTQPANYTDYVLLHYRGWLMPSEYVSEDNTTKVTKYLVFSQTYLGDFNPATAAPIQMYVAGATEGFQTALQQMVEGDEWYIYIPHQLAYKGESSSAIPAYSTLLFLVNVVGIYEDASDIPDWK